MLPAVAKCQSDFNLPGIALPGIQTNDSALALSGINLEGLLANAPQCSGSGCTILPVTLLSFKAERQSNSEVLLNWETTNEYNNTGFDVERSLANTDSFTKRNFVPAKISISAKKQYNLTDNNSFSGTSYYRLKQVDADGRFIYSSIVSVKGYDAIEGLSIYPNPVTDYLKTEIFSNKAGTSIITILSAEGKMIFQQPVSLLQGNNVKNLSLSFLAKGIYIIEATSASGKIFSAKFIKQ